MGEEVAHPLLRNQYWVLRHGKSVPNERGIIVSSMENGTLPEYGLAHEGVGQAKLAGESFFKELHLNNIAVENVRICYSPFSRTIQTAKNAANELNIPLDGPQCKVMPELRERYFGPSFELQSHEKYSDIWLHDEKDPFMRPEGGESVADVVSRLSVALTTIESEFQGCVILVVSHGDPLQILQTVLDAAKRTHILGEGDFTSRFEGATVPSVLSQHRKFALQTGEIRHII